jgi:hypothetical protein
LADDRSGKWRGFLTSDTPVECGFEKTQAEMVVDGTKFNMRTSDSAGPVKFEGTIINDTITQKITFNMVNEVGNTNRNTGQLKGIFYSDKYSSNFRGGFYVQEMSDGGYSAHIMVCQVKLNLKYIDKRTQKNNESLSSNKVDEEKNEIKNLLRRGLITEKQYINITNKIQERTMTKQLKETINKIDKLLKDKLINKQEHSDMKKKIVAEHLGLSN